MWSKPGEAVILLTCQFFLPFHPSDGGSWLAANGCAGELCLVPLADHVLAALDDWAAWRDWPTATATVRKTPAWQHLYMRTQNVTTQLQNNKATKHISDSCRPVSHHYGKIKSLTLNSFIDYLLHHNYFIYEFIRNRISWNLVKSISAPLKANQSMLWLLMNIHR